MLRFLFYAYFYRMKKELKRGYRLTPEEEAILRGEFPGTGPGGEAAPSSSDDGDGDKRGEKTVRQRALRTVFPLLIALAMMIGLAYFFYYLVSGNQSGKNPQTEATDSIYVSVSRQFDTYRFPTLSAEERELFVRKLSLTPAEEEAFWPEFYRFADRLGQAEAIRQEWTSRLSKGDFRITTPGRTMQQYEALYKTQTNLVENYSKIFSNLLSPERMPWVFILHDQIRRERPEQTL